MSASGMIDGIITNLSSASVLGASGASTDYFIMEQSNACCAVVGWQNIEYAPQTFGNPMGGGVVNTILVEGYIRDWNDPVVIMKSNAGFADLLMSSLISDDTLQGSVDTIQRISARRNPSEAYSIAGFTWLPVYIEVDGFEFTD